MLLVYSEKVELSTDGSKEKGTELVLTEYMINNSILLKRAQKCVTSCGVSSVPCVLGINYTELILI